MDRALLIIGAVSASFIIFLVSVVIDKVDDLNHRLDQQTQTTDGSTHWVEPYGGCKEAGRYPGTKGYRQCERRGLLP